MGWCRITVTAEDRVRLPKEMLRQLDAMNAEADRLDPLTRPDVAQDRREQAEDWGKGGSDEMA